MIRSRLGSEMVEVDFLILAVVLVPIISGLVIWWLDYLSEDERIHRLKVRAGDRGILNKAHDIISLLGEDNQFQEGRLVIDRQGRDEIGSDGDYISRWRRLSVRNGDMIVFEASHYPFVTDNWTRDILRFIPGPWEKEFDKLYERVEVKKLKVAQSHQEEQRRRSGLGAVASDGTEPTPAAVE